MDSNDLRSPCVVEKPHIVLDDLLTTARRKRRATRMSYIPPRPTKRPAGDSSYGCGSICSFGDFVRNKSRGFECKYLGGICREGYASRVLASGLDRSLSLPADSYEISKGIGISYRRIGGSQEDNAEFLQSYIVGISLLKDCRAFFTPPKTCPTVNTQTSNLPSQVVSSGHCVDNSALHLAKAVSDIPLLHLDNASFESAKDSFDGERNPSQKSNNNVNMHALESAEQSFDGVGSPSQASNGDLAHKVDTSDGSSPKILADDLYLVGTTAFLKKNTEGELCNISRDCTLKMSQERPSNHPPSAKMLICGRRREMEDTAVAIPSFMKISKCSPSDKAKNDADLSDLHFYAVYDGHGGSQASIYCAQRFHHALEEEITLFSLTGSSEIGDWKSAISSCFMKVDKEVGGICPYGTCDDIHSTADCCSGTIAPENVGTTAVVAVMSSSHIVIANCGDSRALLCKGGEAIALSQDHKPERVDETRRIEAAGGCVTPWKGYRVAGLLALSRAIGDRYLKRYVIAEPDMVYLERSDEDEFLILASDGLWDVIDNESACHVARRCFASSQRDDLASATAASTLVKLAFSKGSQDNISVVVVDLRRRQK
ncbi:hypothetical protein KP509_15G024500 [Ceratopteris richardii]|uniref:protein-serine/threonine phosphatase n=1 Tax=Ceratopteris richardii TaxID=49495 RepID=A0A8T2T1U1_CERRI|nr:hypothetical protein KP509_15G024500 [Ceratopteris richardii]